MRIAMAPTARFSPEVIARGLPERGGFGRSDLRWCPAASEPIAP
jgi:hypothetical protein